MKKPATPAIERYGSGSKFDSQVLIACVELAPDSEATRNAYLSDYFKHWCVFCREYSIDPQNPEPDPESKRGSVAAWMEWMKKRKDAPKSRARRLSAMSSVYRQLRRNGHVRHNPFSVDEGPKRGRALPLEATQIASPVAIRKVLATCDESVLGIRDAAIIRVLWATGIRRASLVSMSHDRIRKERTGYVGTVIGKGNKELRILVRGHAADAFAKWLATLEAAKVAHGPIWRTKAGAMTERAVGHMLDRRAKAAGVTERLSPHAFRVSFLTFNPAPLDSKQDAAGHADPATTRLYDRSSWKGREAFEKMPEIEDVED